MRIMRYFAPFVLGVGAAISIELASDRSETTRVLGSISPLAWVILAVLTLLALIGIISEWEDREESEKQRKDEEKPWRLRSS